MQKRLALGIKLENLWVWDVETYDWDQPLCAVAISGAGERVRFFGPDCIARMVAFMLKTRGTFVAHFGGGFDIPLALNHHKFRKIILTGSNILIAEDRNGLSLRDSFPWFLNSLEKIGQALGVLKNTKIDRTNLLAHTEEEILDYCEQDCHVLLAAILAALEFLQERGARSAWTAGASAISLLRALEPGTWHGLEANRLDVDIVCDALDRGIVRGGRVECFRKGYVPTVYPYDLKSSYPSRYANRALPVGFRVATRKDVVGVWRCRWVWKDRHLIPPALDEATHAGVGPCEAWLGTDEIAALESCGVAVNRFEGFAPTTMLEMGQIFVRELYAEKERGSFFAKVWINSLHGKLSEHPLKDCYTLHQPRSYYEREGVSRAGPYWHWSELKCDENDLCAPYIQPLAAATILERARVGLWDINRVLQEAGWQVFYNDTDSVHTDCPPSRMPIVLGKSLGMLASEGGPYEGYYLGPKAYCLVNEKGVADKIALKGVPVKSYVNAVEVEGAIREAFRARPGRDAEQGKDLRIEVFKRALSGGARCRKEGITSFKGGLRGVIPPDSDATEREPLKWQRARLTRVIKPSGRGKIFGEKGSNPSWGYLSTLEIATLSFLQSLPIRRATWERVPKTLRDKCIADGLVTMGPAKIILAPAGAKWLDTFDDSSDVIAEDDDVIAEKYEA